MITSKDRLLPEPVDVIVRPTSKKRTAQALARKHAREAIDALVEVVNSPNQPGQVRIAAATALLDRGYGKPSETHEHSGNVQITEVKIHFPGQN